MSSTAWAIFGPGIRIGIAGCSFFIGAFMTMDPVTTLAQSTSPQASLATPGLDVPTTKLLAIGSFTAKALPDVWRPMLPNEAREATRLYLAGKIDQWYVKQDGSGIVLLMNCTDAAEARELLGQLPAVHAGLMDFQIVALGPLSPLRSLLTETPK